MTEKRFIRNIMGDIYDSKTDKWFEEDWKGKPLDYDDDLIVFLNEQQATISALKEENEKLRFLIDINSVSERRKLERQVDEQQAEIERLNKELIKAITKSIPPKKYEDIDKKHKPWKYVNTNCD